ncbi:glyoxylate/hydroxypyruvate reductase A [Brucella sp. BE17]|uniref:2-hydroxyacid dehydrogenase n=1 Tax=Brucella sp. BE17 TaxID=3142977 RepID=UPI0031B9F5B5
MANTELKADSVPQNEQNIGALLFYSEFDSPDEWQEVIKAELPELDFRVYPDVGDPTEVKYILAWKPYDGFFNEFENLALVINLGAGVDALLQRTDLPQVPIARLSDKGMVQLMKSYVLFAVLRYARDIPSFEAAKRAKTWTYIHPRPLHRIKVGVIGLGQLGSSVADALASLSFDVRGWDAYPKNIEGVKIFQKEAFSQFVEDLDICVNMLPLTPETSGLLDREFFKKLPSGCYFINASRGAVVDEDALLEALESDHIAGATLDAFCVEPLPENHPFWEMDNVLITPHLASITVPETAALDVVENIRRINRGEMPKHQISFAKGY